MRIAGQRADGALYLSLGGGVAVMLKGYRVTQPLDATVVDGLGPWLQADNSYAERTRVERILNVATLDFNLAFGAVEKENPFAEKTAVVGEKKENPFAAKKENPFAEGEKKDAPFGGKKAAPFGKKDGEEKAEDGESKDAPFGGKKAAPFGKKEAPVALDKFHSLDEAAEEKEKKPVSEVAQATQEGEATAPPPATEVLNLMPVVDPAEERKKKRGALKDKIKAAARSKGRTADVLGDEEITDEDLFAMAKELGVTIEETPDAVTLVDNATKFQRLLASTTIAKHIHLAGGEHPFTYCMENVVPAMEKEGKGPDDPEAFCAYWKQENA